MDGARVAQRELRLARAGKPGQNHEMFVREEIQRGVISPDLTARIVAAGGIDGGLDVRNCNALRHPLHSGAHGRRVSPDPQLVNFFPSGQASEISDEFTRQQTAPRRSCRRIKRNTISSGSLQGRRCHIDVETVPKAGFRSQSLPVAGDVDRDEIVAGAVLYRCFRFIALLFALRRLPCRFGAAFAACPASSFRQAWPESLPYPSDGTAK